MYNVAPKKFAVEILKEKEDLLDQLAEKISGVGANNEDSQSNTSNLRFRSIIEKILAWMSEPIEKRARIYAAEQAAINSSTTGKDPFSKDNAIALEKYFERKTSPLTQEEIEILASQLTISPNVILTYYQNRLSKEHARALEQYFLRKTSPPTEEEFGVLAAELNVSPNVILTYYHNFRSRLMSQENEAITNTGKVAEKCSSRDQISPHTLTTIDGFSSSASNANNEGNNIINPDLNQSLNTSGKAIKREPGLPSKGPTEQPPPLGAFARQSKFFIQEQKHILDMFYIMRSKYPSKEDIKLLAAQLNCQEKQVSYYFNNRRTRLGSNEPPPQPQATFGRKPDSKFLSVDQKHVLDQYYILKSMYPSNEDITLLAAQLNITEKSVKYYFNNKRTRSGEKGAPKLPQDNTSMKAPQDNASVKSPGRGRQRLGNEISGQSPTGPKNARGRKPGKNNTTFESGYQGNPQSLAFGSSGAVLADRPSMALESEQSSTDYDIKPNVSELRTGNGSFEGPNSTQTDTAFNTTLANNQDFASITKIKTEPGESTSTSPKKQLNTDQKRELELYFTKRSQYPPREDIELLAKLLCMQERTIQIFFQNRRAKAKKLGETFGDPSTVRSEPIDSTTGREGARSKYLLEQFFTLQSQYPTKKDIELLGTLIGMNEHSVKIWFQNRRAKATKEFVRGTGSVKLEAPQSQSPQTGSKRKGAPSETPPYFQPSPVKQELLEESEQNNVVYTTQNYPAGNTGPPKQVVGPSDHTQARHVGGHVPTLSVGGIPYPGGQNPSITAKFPTLTAEHRRLLTNYFVMQSKYPTKEELDYLNSQLGLDENTILNFLKEHGLVSPTVVR